MSIGKTLFVAASIVTPLLTGCVDRRFVIDSNIPNAQVYIDNRPIGAAPAYSSFEYYGHYNITLVEPGYETINQRVHVRAPWYAYPPFDFIAEVVWPFHIQDTRRYHFELKPAVATRVDDLVNQADALRVRGMNLPAPECPAEPKAGTLPPVVVAPPAGPNPGSPGLVPSVTPPQ